MSAAAIQQLTFPLIVSLFVYQLCWSDRCSRLEWYKESSFIALWLFCNADLHRPHNNYILTRWSIRQSKILIIGVILHPACCRYMSVHTFDQTCVVIMDGVSKAHWTDLLQLICYNQKEISSKGMCLSDNRLLRRIHSCSLNRVYSIK